MISVRVTKIGEAVVERLSSFAGEAYSKVRQVPKDARIPRVCPQCHPQAFTPFYIAYCGEHGGSA